MRSCTIRLAAIALLLLAPNVQAAEGEVAPNPNGAEAAAPSAPADPLAETADPLLDAENAAPQSAGWGAGSANAVATESEDAAAAEPADAVALEPAPAAPSDDRGAAWDEIDAPTDVVAEVPDAPMAPPAEPTAAKPGMTLGPMAVDAEGREGRIHTVRTGDTLWDISKAYLGTAWVWPSVWTDNDEIQNPHRINPGDHIWITSGEMRIVSKREADGMIAAKQDMAQSDGDGQSMDAADSGLEPAELIEGPGSDDDMLAGDDAPAALDPLASTVPLDAPQDLDKGFTVRVAELEAMGFVSADAIEAATSIVDSPSPRKWLVDGDMIDLGIGEGDVEVGDEFTIFRDAVPVYDVDGGRLLGYHVELLGWAVVREVTGETALSEIRMSQYEMKRGDRVIPRNKPSVQVSVKTTPDAVEGNIVYMPDDRTRMADGDHVYINRGSLHGFEIGSEVEVYAPGSLQPDKVKGNQVRTPDRVIGRMVLVEVQPESSVAYVLMASRELERGDRVRAATSDFVRR